MFNSVQFVRDICQQRKIPISQLEKECGFSNGYLNPKKMSKIPYDRAQIIAAYLGVSAESILTGTENNCVERVKAICKERKIAISRLEKDLGFANGYIGQLRKGTFPAERLSDIAEYLSVSAEYLMTGEEKAPTEAGERAVSDAELKFALWGDCEDVSDDDLADVRRYAAFVRERKKDKK